jgi:hypothetical protein
LVISLFYFCFLSDPWEHIAFGVVGGTLGYQFSKYNDRNREDLLQLMASMDKFGTAGPPASAAHGDDDDE